jgi:hypothetical protein
MVVNNKYGSDSGSESTDVDPVENMVAIPVLAPGVVIHGSHCARGVHSSYSL